MGPAFANQLEGLAVINMSTFKVLSLMISFGILVATIIMAAK